MTSDFVTLTAWARDSRGDRRSTMLTLSTSSYDHESHHALNLVRSWFAEDNPDIDSRDVQVEVDRG